MIKFEDNSKEAKKAVNKARDRGYLSVGLFLQGISTLLAPVDTGRLRASITFATPEETGKVGAKAKGYEPTGKTKDTLQLGTNVEYAPDMELGKHRKPFLKPAIANNISKIKEIMAKEMAKIDD
jgi:hypothetical protein